jgi:preprotein translocase subunit Sss1
MIIRLNRQKPERFVTPLARFQRILPAALRPGRGEFFLSPLACLAGIQHHPKKL